MDNIKNNTNEEVQELPDQETEKQAAIKKKKKVTQKKNFVTMLFPTRKTEKTNDGMGLPKTAQDTIPYVNVFKNGIIESKPGFFTKSYKLTDINFRVAAEEDQDRIFKNYKEFLATFGADTMLQIVVNNRNEDKNEIINSVLCKMEADNYNEYRIEMNEMLKDKMSEGRNNLISEKYLVVGTKRMDFNDVRSTFSRIDSEINQKFKDISSSQEVQTEPDYL